MKISKGQTVVLVFLMIWYGWFFLKKIDLTVLDLGRHVKNGEMILKGEWGIFDSNFYSYTEPSFPTVNHHWGAGVIFFLVQQVFGFSGLSLFYLCLSLAVFYIFFYIAQKEAGFNISLLLSSFLIPLMAARTEIRPEGFSYLFIGLFFLILWRWRRGEIDRKWLWSLPLMQILWVNLHIYFLFGIALVGLFWVDSLVRRDSGQARMTEKILGLVGLSSLLSPFGLKGVIYPLNILREYGYDIVENKSVKFLLEWGFKEPNLRLFQIGLVVLVLSFVWLYVKNRKKFSFVYFILAVVWGGLGLVAIRNFSMFGFFSLVIVGYNLKNLKTGIEKISLSASVLAALFVVANSFYFYYPKLPWGERVGMGLVEGQYRSVEFYQEAGLKGPVFNNYDVGGYLIYNFYPEWKVFTDNRPEAYSVAHFKDIYIPAQQEESKWRELDSKYGFNVIYFSHRDYTDWGQKFLIDRVKDGDWVVVYYDQFVIIFLKNNELNKETIEKYEVPKEIFGL